jgi:RNA polymerase sigma-70 factor (ECF subfamily)
MTMYKDHETPRFWINYGAALRSYVQKKVTDKHSVEDILHEVYLKIFCYCKRHDFCCDKAGVKNIRSWVFQVCHNTIIDFQKEKAKYAHDGDWSEVLPDDSSASVLDRPVKLEELIQNLPAKYAEAVYYDSVLLLKQADIADKLGVSLSAAKSRIQRGKKMFRDMYMQHL